MANIGKVVYLSDAQRETLFTNNSVTVDGVTVTYNDNDLYVTPENAVETVVRELLWENPSPTSGFTAQNVSVGDLTGYQFVDIEINPFLIDGTRSISRHKIGATGACFHMQLNPDTATNAITILFGACRTISVNTDNIAFSNGQIIANGDVYTDIPEGAVPTRIWGVKYSTYGKVVTAANSGNTNRTIWVSDVNAVPTGAAPGDIVLVKA